MRNIVLTGFMGTGKTAVGRELSRILGMPVIDIDHEIEKAEGTSISGIFADKGEEYFRDLESLVIKRVSASEGIIISTGGGAVLREENVSALGRNGMIFCLAAGPEEIIRRIGGNDERPLLRGDDRMERITSLLDQRKPFYDRAGIVINTDKRTPLEVAGEIAEIYNG
jgi:shikimate kinase